MTKSIFDAYREHTVAPPLAEDVKSSDQQIQFLLNEVRTLRAMVERLQKEQVSNRYDIHQVSNALYNSRGDK